MQQGTGNTVMVVPPSRDLLVPWLEEGRGDVIAASYTVTKERAENIFAPPREGTPGVHIWLDVPKGREVPRMDKETCERLKARGYITIRCSRSTARAPAVRSRAPSESYPP